MNRKNVTAVQLCAELQRMNRESLAQGDYSGWLARSQRLVESFGTETTFTESEIHRIQKPWYLNYLAKQNNDLYALIDELVPQYNGNLSPKAIEVLTYISVPLEEAWQTGYKRSAL